MMCLIFLRSLYQVKLFHQDFLVITVVGSCLDLDMNNIKYCCNKDTEILFLYFPFFFLANYDTDLKVSNLSVVMNHP